jgi:hypothetical protein
VEIGPAEVRREQLEQRSVPPRETAAIAVDRDAGDAVGGGAEVDGDLVLEAGRREDHVVELERPEGAGGQHVGDRQRRLSLAAVDDQRVLVGEAGELADRGAGSRQARVPDRGGRALGEVDLVEGDRPRHEAGDLQDGIAERGQVRGRLALPDQLERPVEV